MVKTIGNPLSWGAHAVEEAGHMISHGADRLGSHSLARPEVNTLTRADLRAALRAGMADLAHFRSDVLMIVLIYPVVGLLLSFIAFQQNLIPLLFPIAAGFALLGPLAATGFYELSRRREAGQPASWADAFRLMLTPTLAPVLALGLYLIALYVVWLYAAAFIYQVTLAPLFDNAMPGSLVDFLTLTFATPEGWAMIAVGMGIGLAFAVLALATGLTSFAMLVDRPSGLPVAVTTSLAVARKNPGVVAQWGLIVALLLALASVPLFLGLIFVMPLLGHATWHLYRRAVHYDAAEVGEGEQRQGL